MPSKEIDEFTRKSLPEIISNLDAKTPEAERFLLEIARLAGLEQAVLFNGAVVNLSQPTPDADAESGSDDNK